MSLTPEDLNRIGAVVDSRIDHSIDRIAGAVTEKLEANSLGDMKRDIGNMKGDIRSMAEDLTKVMERTEEIPLINQKIEALQNAVGI